MSTSIRRSLLIWLSLALVLGLALAAALIYRQARDEADQLLDYQLRQVAASLPSHEFSPIGPGRDQLIDPSQDIVIQIWDFTGLRLYYSHGASILPQRAELGFSNLRTPEGWWRVYSAELGHTVVQVAQPLAGRTEIAVRNALRTVLPLLLLLPILAGILWFAVGRGLAPVRRLAAEVQARDARSPAPLPPGEVPEEIAPLRDALDDLLIRLGRAMNAQRAFIADAAHELRTPLTALRLQLHSVEHATDAEARAAAGAELRRGLDRATRLVNQLLAMARAEAGGGAGGAGGANDRAQAAPVALRELAAEAVAGQALIAAGRGIDLGLLEGGEATVEGHADSLRVLLDNLIDNALRHTPEGGRVDVEVVPGTAGAGPVLTVRDTGPGIDPAHLDRVFERFHRVPGTGVEGSGLGLAIVREIATAHGAQVSLVNEGGGPGGGLRAQVAFPVASPFGRPARPD